MTAKVEHWPAAGDVLLQQPRARIIGGRIEPFKRIDLRQHRYADFTGFDNALNAFDHGIEVSVVSHAELHPIVASGSNHPIALLHRDCHWLFTKHMLPRSSPRD